MSADNELAIATFTDCIVVQMQFASYFWDEQVQNDPEYVREAFSNPIIFHTIQNAEKYAFKEENKSYYEYGIGYYDYAYPLVPKNT